MQMPGRVYEGQPLDDAGFDGGVPQSLTMGTGAAYNTSTTLIYEAEDNFTVELWVKPTATHEIDAESQYGFSGTTGQKFVIDPVHDFGGTGIAGMGISVGTNGVSVYEHADGYMPALLVWESPTPLTAWTHVAVVYENKTPKLYINGVLVRIGLESTRSHVYPGNLVASGQYGTMEGQADEVRVWSTVRSQQQIQEGMHSTAQAPQAGLAAYWPLKGSDGTTLQDISGNNHHVVLNSSYGTGNWSSDAADLRSYKGSGYRYAFNGKEDDKDVAEGIQDYGMRIYDERISRFLSEDPITKKYPELTPYQFAGNMPIHMIDLDGLEPTNNPWAASRGLTVSNSPTATPWRGLKTEIKDQLIVAAPFTIPILISGAAEVGFVKLATMMFKGGVVGGTINGGVSVVKGEDTYSVLKSTASGFAGGAVLGAFGPLNTVEKLVVAGSFSGAASEVTSQSVDLANNRIKEFNLSDIGISSALGAISTYLSDKIVKFANGQISKKFESEVAKLKSPEFVKKLNKINAKENPNLSKNAVKQKTKKDIFELSKAFNNHENLIKIITQQIVDRILDEGQNSVKSITPKL